MALLLVVSDDIAASPPHTPDWPALDVLAHDISVVPHDTQALTQSATADVVVLDGRRDLAGARTMARLFTSSGSTVPLLLAVTEGDLPSITPDWGVSDFVLDTATAAEFDARIRMLVATVEAGAIISCGGIVIDDAAYSTTIHGVPLDLTYTEFELLKYLVQHPGRVFSRDHLLTNVWGYDYYGGMRTVDVHIRRLRAKLGPEHEALIGTVRNVGYRFSPDGGRG